MGNIGGGEILVILLLGLVVLGPGRLAVVARTEYHEAQPQDAQDLATPDVSHGVNLSTP